MKIFVNFDGDNVPTAESEHELKSTVPGDLDGIYEEPHVMFYSKSGGSFVLFGSVEELQKLQSDLDAYIVDLLEREDE